jgi:hypothetical protein
MSFRTKEKDGFAKHFPCIKVYVKLTHAKLQRKQNPR